MSINTSSTSLVSNDFSFSYQNLFEFKEDDSDSSESSSTTSIDNPVNLVAAGISAAHLVENRTRNDGKLAKAAVPKVARRKVLALKADGVQFVKVETPVKQKGDVNKNDLLQHAKMRLLTFALTVKALYGLAVRSDDSRRRDVEITCKHASLQIGKGTSNGDVSYHAAHPNAAAGVVDNVRDLYIAEMTKENTVTPKKRKILEYKGFTREDFDEIEKNNFSLTTVQEIFQRIWPVDNKIPHSVISGTRLEKVNNFTTEVHWIINLWCDKGLEHAVRSKIEELYRQVMYTEITEDEACDKYRHLVHSYFASIEPDLQKWTVLLNDYLVNFDELRDCENLDRDALIDITKKLKLISSQFNPPDCKAYKHPTMARNTTFLRRLITTLNDDNEDSLMIIKKWLSKHFQLLRDEIAEQCSNFSKYLEYTLVEKEGTLSVVGPLLDQDEDDEDTNFGNKRQHRLLKPSTTPLQASRLVLRNLDDDGNASRLDRTETVKKLVFSSPKH